MEKRDWVALTDVLTNVCLSFCRAFDFEMRAKDMLDVLL